ncbi:uncharacterized protein LOC143615565 [Bidens hawaiensis]|uniref:uncharacterized protein LOC143615565 n=1 Tax=Bidens hawaiensis TaxID=980011 RepID=UPI00404B50B3
MADQDSTENPSIKRIKQTISVPFLWEEKPGTPKNDWKRANHVMQLPVKLIASVPFMWEEKPGTPLPGPFTHQSPGPTIPTSPEWQIQNLSSVETNNIPVKTGQMCQNWTSNESAPTSPPHLQQHSNNPFCDSVSDSYCDLDQEHQASNHPTHGKYNPFCDSSDDELQAPSSPAWETESFASSYATGTTSLAGSSFLECMFPLMAPKTSFLETVGCSRTRTPPTNSCTEIVSYGGERKPLTLGELIMMSRRRSYLKKAIESQDQYYHSMELMARNGFGCCNIDVGGLKRQLQLKLI